MSDFIIRISQIHDLEQFLILWRKVGFKIGVSEERAEFSRFLERNSTTCLTGELNGDVIGSVLGGFDGRRGLIHHLAVDPDYQGRGYGRNLLDSVMDRFIELGVVKVNLWIEAWNKPVIDFYCHLGWELRDLTTMSKILRS